MLSCQNTNYIYSIHVLIPSYSFHGYAIKKWRPLGVGYAEFATKEDVSKVIEELDGALFNDRKIMIRAYRVASNEKSEPIPAPITKSKPKSKSKSRTKPRSPKPKTPSVPNSPKVVPSSPKVPEFDCTLIPVAANLKPTKEANNTSDVIVTKDRFKLSEDTIYINKVSNLVTIEDVKDFFEGYNVGSVYLFEKKDIAGSNQIKRTFSMSGRQRSVLVTLKSKKKEVVDPELLVSEPVDETVEPESIKLLDVIKEFRSKKLDGRTVILRAAYLTKVDEVLRAANSTNYSFYD